MCAWLLAGVKNNLQGSKYIYVKWPGVLMNLVIVLLAGLVTFKLL